MSVVRKADDRDAVAPKPKRVRPGKEPETERDLAGLWVLRDTLRCAQAGCVPCCYKVVLKAGPGAAPNARPEACPRFVAAGSGPCRSGDGGAGRPSGLYLPSHRVLTVGDGDFSFSLALVRALGPRSGLVGTSYERLDSLREVYPEIDATLAEIRRLGGEVFHGVDAADLAGTLPPSCNAAPNPVTFDRVVWNFPCVARAEDGSVLPGAGAGADARSGAELEQNRSLVSRFVAGGSALLSAAGEVHVTHKIKLQQWDIERQGTAKGGAAGGTAGADSACRFAGSVVFDRSSYPPYAPRQALRNRSFPISDAQTFVFSRAPADRTATLAVGPALAPSANPEDAVLCASADAVVKLEAAIVIDLQRALLVLGGADVAG